MKLREYINAGWVIIPCKYKSKIPLIKWGMYRYNKPIEEEYKVWFNGTPKNVAVITGKLSGICIIDFDSQEAIDNHKELSEIDTFTVKSNRGIHKYFKYPENVNLTNVLKNEQYKDIDFKMNDCLCTIPPSIHSSGHKYSVLSGDINNLSTLPDKIIKLCTYKEKLRAVFNEEAYYFNNPILNDVRRISIHQILQDFHIKKAHGNFYYCYAGHDKDTPSLLVYDTNTYSCFGCGQGGNPVNLVMKINKCTKAEAVNYLVKNYCS